MAPMISLSFAALTDEALLSLLYDLAVGDASDSEEFQALDQEMRRRMAIDSDGAAPRGTSIVRGAFA